MKYRTGIGYDIHRLEEGRKLILGGIELASDKGLLGHSDADVLVHAIIDALLGAIAAGDIGTHFPPDDEQYKDIDSLLLLKKTIELVTLSGYKVCNIDSNIITEKPKLMPHIDKMTKKLSEILEINETQLSIKAKTNEGLDATGSQQAIAAQVVVLLEKIQ